MEKAAQKKILVSFKLKRPELEPELKRWLSDLNFKDYYEKDGLKFNLNKGELLVSRITKADAVILLVNTAGRLGVSLLDFKAKEFSY